MPSDRLKRRYLTDVEWKALNPLLGGGLVGREELEVQPVDFKALGQGYVLGEVNPVEPDVLRLGMNPQVRTPTVGHEAAHSLQHKVPSSYHYSRKELPEEFVAKYPGGSPYYYGGPGGLETAHREGLKMKDFHSEQQAAIIEDFFHDLSTARKQGYSTQAAKRLPAAGAYMQQLKTAVITKQTQGLKAKMTKSPIQWWSDWLKRRFK